MINQQSLVDSSGLLLDRDLHLPAPAAMLDSWTQQVSGPLLVFLCMNTLIWLGYGITPWRGLPMGAG